MTQSSDQLSRSSASATPFTLEYHVPRSQVWEGSRGAQSGGVHLCATEDVTLTAKRGRCGTLTIKRHGTLCRKRGWYERPVENESDLRVRCSECVRRAARYGVEWPASPFGGQDAA